MLGALLLVLAAVLGISSAYWLHATSADVLYIGTAIGIDDYAVYGWCVVNLFNAQLIRRL